METSPWWLLLLRLVIVTAALSVISKPANSQPQTNLLVRGCSQYNATNTRHFFNNLNATFADLRTQLGRPRRFATSLQSKSSDPVYAMVQCRNYMSEGDCLACYDAAVTQIRNCSAANGARVVYDGCFLRYESDNFYHEGSLAGNVQICNNQTAPQSSTFTAQARTLLQNLELATPRMNGYFAATARRVAKSGNLTVYGIAQCAETISQTSCRDCLTKAYENIQGCMPDAEGRAIDAACFLRYSITPFFANNQTINITPFLRGGGHSSNKNVITGGVGGGAALLLILFAFFLCYHFSRKSTKTGRDNILGATELQGPKIYSYKDLNTATNNFSEENKLGEGGFGDVYKATLENGNIVAVKKLDISYGRAKADFETEVRLISNVHHRNLVRLLGCCSKRSDLLLVYEYMANGSLDRFLFGEKRGVLSWKQRFDIILGTAKGLAYLHEHYHVCIIHRDIKPGNILLDDDFQAKIADFGLARLLPENRSHVSTKFAGTLGYTAPEYAVHGHLSEKVDIYSFGIVILEIISGRRISDVREESETGYLLQKAWKLYESGRHQKLADKALDTSDYKQEDVKKMVEIALICTQSPPSSRPSMSEILLMLLSNVATEPRAPNRPLSFTSGNSSSPFTGSSASNATVSVTHEFTGR